METGWVPVPTKYVQAEAVLSISNAIPSCTLAQGSHGPFGGAQACIQYPVIAKRTSSRVRRLCSHPSFAIL